MQLETRKKTNELDLYRKRVGILIGARIKDTDIIISAVEVQNKLRKKAGMWSGTEEIRKWRNRAA